MKISLAEWKKVPNNFEDRKAESYLKAIPKLYKAFFADQSKQNNTVLVNNIAALKKEIVRMKKEQKSDRAKMTAITKLEALIANGESQINLDRQTHAKGLAAHLKLRNDTIRTFKTTHKTAVATFAGDVKQRVKKMKNSMKAKDRDEMLTDREFMLGLMRHSEGVEENMKTDMKPVRVPEGAMKKALQYLSKEAKAGQLIPKTNELFTINKKLLTDLRAARKEAQKWIDNAQTLGDAWA